MPARSLFLLLGLITLFLAGYNVNACTCGGTGSPCESYGSADAVFVGTPISVKDNERPKQRDADIEWTPRTVKFSVEQAYLGVAGTEIEVATGFGGGDCGYPFQSGQRYLVYAYRYKEKLTTSICTRTKSFSKANEDLAFLGTLPTAAQGVTIWGELNQSDLKGDPVSSDFLVTIEGNSERKEIRPDARGRFRVSGLRPGEYKVSVQLPETLTTYQPQREITVADRGCAGVVWHLADNGRVTGRVVNPVGEAVAGILVALVEPGANPKENYVKLERTNEEGRFTFSAVPRGRYVIAINHNRFPDPSQPSNAYPPSFYPGVIDQTQAQVLTVGPGEKLSELEIRVPTARPLSVLTGTVVWSDGSPVANARLSVTDVTQGETSISHGVQVDAHGKFTINGYAGQKLIIEAGSNRPYVPKGDRFEPMERSDKPRITLERPTETLRIVITKIR